MCLAVSVCWWRADRCNELRGRPPRSPILNRKEAREPHMRSSSVSRMNASFYGQLEGPKDVSNSTQNSEQNGNSSKWVIPNSSQALAAVLAIIAVFIFVSVVTWTLRRLTRRRKARFRAQKRAWVKRVLGKHQSEGGHNLPYVDWKAELDTTGGKTVCELSPDSWSGINAELEGCTRVAELLTDETIFRGELMSDEVASELIASGALEAAQ